MKKIISYSLFGDEPKYYVGAEKNIILNKELLPDWQTVIYFHPERIIKNYDLKLKELGATLIDVSSVTLGGKDSAFYSYFWRFLAFLEDGLNLSRDLDSRISTREVEYIKRWEESNKTYFIIRDHPWHAPVPSGLFGIRNRVDKFVDHLNTFIQTSDLRWGADQDVLYDYMQNIPREELLYCGFDDLSSHIKRDDRNFFIGMQLDEDDKPTKPSGEKCIDFLNEIDK